MRCADLVERVDADDGEEDCVRGRGSEGREGMAGVMGGKRGW